MLRGNRGIAILRKADHLWVRLHLGGKSQEMECVDADALLCQVASMDHDCI